MTFFRVFAAATLLLVVGSTSRGDFFPSLVLTASGVDDGVLPLADVYALVIDFPPEDVEAIRLNLSSSRLGVSGFLVESGGFYSPSDLDFRGGVLPTFRGFPITDSFVVLPEGLSPIISEASFAADQITVEYAAIGGGVLAAQGTSTTLAHLSVPAGESPIGACNLVRASYAGSGRFSWNICPEPTTALMACLGVFGGAGRRSR